ncbi:hypothetical protein [Nocardioides montaniterrae]
MTDPRLAEPQRVQVTDPGTACGDTACVDEHVYWCWKRKTGAALLVGAVVGIAVWWSRR